VRLSSFIKGDKAIWAVVIILSIVSTVVVYSSTGALAYKRQNGNTEFYLFKHVFTLVFGLGLMVLTHNIKYIYYNRLSQIALFAAIPLLIFTLAKGSNLNEASRWIQIPVINLTFQTSDFAKLALISYVARMLAVKQEKLHDFKEGFLPIILPVVVICALILPANFSTAAVLFTTCFTLMFIGRVHYKHMFALVGIGIAGILIILAVGKFAPKVFPRFGTWMKRIENFQSKDSKGNFQVEQAKIAIATGAPFGKGPGKSTQRNFLPHPYSDFIYAIIIEEYGTLMGLGILLLYIIILFRGLRILKRCDKTFGSLLAFGLSFSLVFQGLINMAVATNLFPVTGQPLPLLSMGGTSIWFTSISIGIILSVSRDLEGNTDNEEENNELNEGVEDDQLENEKEVSYA
jgi:cell division protein FtsW